MTRSAIGAALAVALFALFAPRVAEAFCGLYVAGGTAPMYSDATQVVVMRHGTRTVLSMQTSYVGPQEPFAIVVPVPATVQERDIEVLDPDVFDAIERASAPRLVEYWEQDPCASDGAAKPAAGTQAAVAAGQADGDHDGAPEITFGSLQIAGEYQIAIVRDAAAFDAWSRREKVRIPAGVEPVLRGYFESGLKLVVAKVDPTKVAFAGDRAVLSPLRVRYDSEQLVLPIQLGLANSPGTQDLLVYVLAPERYEAAGFRNLTIPTNVTVKKDVRDKFGAFYASLFDATLDHYHDAVITEYAWDATSCEPCAGPALSAAHLRALGADALGGATNLVLTRLHARYGKDLETDLVLRPAPPIAGGRERTTGAGRLERGAQPAQHNRFQARYAIRHRWTGPLTCEQPVRGRWRAKASYAKPALDLAFAPRGAVELAHVIAHDVPALELTVGEDPLAMPPANVPATGPSTKRAGCSAGTGATPSAHALIALFALLVLRRRPR